MALIAASKPLADSVDHVLITRFNLPSTGAESHIRRRPGWLEDRAALFESICAPSVAAQTGAEVSWIVYFDPDSPAWLVDRLAPLTQTGLFRPLYRREVPRRDLITDLAEVTGRRAPILITTNLDNDDGLATDFAQRIQSAQTAAPSTAIYARDGLVGHERNLYYRRDSYNAFCSVRESWDDAVTCWAAAHNQLHALMPTHVVADGPAWLQVVHGRNVSNRVRGRLVAPERFVTRFPQLPALFDSPSRSMMLADRLLYQPSRMAREVGRTGAKRLILTVAGQPGLDALKEVRASRAS